MKKAFDAIISRLNMAKERISELEHMSIVTSKTEMQREIRNIWNRLSKNCGTIIKCVAYIHRAYMYTIGQPEKKKGRNRRNI